MIHSIILNVSILLSSAATTQSFVPNNQRIGVGPYAETYLKVAADASSRRDFFRDGALVGAAVLSVPVGYRTRPAYADAVEDRLNIPRVLRDLRKTKDQLVRAEALAVANDYEGVASTLQRPPFSDFRRNARVLLRTLGEDTPERLTLQKKFEGFVAACEKLSAQTNKGVRGSKVDIKDAYAAVLVALDGLLDYAGKLFPAVEAVQAASVVAAPAPFLPEPSADAVQAASVGAAPAPSLPELSTSASAPSSPVDYDDLEAAKKRIVELKAKLAVIEDLTR